MTIGRQCCESDVVECCRVQVLCASKCLMSHGLIISVGHDQSMQDRHLVVSGEFSIKNTSEKRKNCFRICYGT